MSDNDTYAQEIAAQQFETFCFVASTALLLFDFALTFPTEVQCIWGRKFSGATLVYIVTRYTSIIVRMLSIAAMYLWNASDQTCSMLVRADDVMITLNYLAFSAFTILGVYGVWGPDWKPLLVVVPLTLTKPALYIYLYTQYYPIEAGAPIGCSNTYVPENATLPMLTQIATIMTVAPNAILVILTWVKTFGIHKVLSKVGMPTALTTLLLHDGTAYFVILLLSRIVTIVSDNINTDSLVLLVWPNFDNVLSPILLSRFLLDACALNFTDRRAHMGIPADSTISASSAEMSEVRFNASRILGNLSVTRHEASLNGESRSAHPHGSDIEEVERIELPQIVENNLSDRERLEV